MNACIVNNTTQYMEIVFQVVYRENVATKYHTYGTQHDMML